MLADSQRTLDAKHMGEGKQQAQPKKLVIRALKRGPKLPANFDDTTWEQLRVAIAAIQHAQPVATSLEELYQAVENMCFHKLSESLYTRLKDVCDAHIKQSLESVAQHVGKGTAVFLKHMNACWQQHCQQMLLIRSVFLYLDRSYVLAQADGHVRSIFDMGLQQFRTHLQEQPQVEAMVVEGVLEMFHADRQGDSVDHALLKSMIRMLMDLGIYESIFLQPFLDASMQLYSKEGSELCSSLPVPEYLLHCERRLTAENDRCKTFLEPGTKKPLIEVVEQQLLSKHFEGLLDRGFKGLMAENRHEDLARLFTLAGRIHFTDKLKVCFKEWVKATGLALVMDTEKDATMIESLLKLKSDMSAILQGPFQNHDDFVKALRDAFEFFVNQRENKPAELIAKHVDAKLKGVNKKVSDAQLEEDLDLTLVLFRYIQGKDVFEAFYKKDLAKRLLMHRSSSIDLEKSMIAKLKAECGSQFTNKLEGMFKDVQLSKDIMLTFKSHSDYQSVPHGIELYVHVLTSGFWPTYPAIEAKLPLELERCQSVFQKFYLSKHSGRKLSWYGSLASCTLKAHFAKGVVKELQVSLHQAIVLLLFNNQEQHTLPELQQATGLPDAELKRTLQSLACGKVRVLSKQPKGKEIEEGDMFHFNNDFTHALYKIKINQIQMKETVEENKKTNEQVLQDRAYQIDAAIVRTMKTRKTLSHKLLINEVILQLKFSVKASDLKKRIESLIEREYLERSSDNRDVYNYLA